MIYSQTPRSTIHLMLDMRGIARPVATVSARSWPIPVFLCPLLASSASLVQSPPNRQAPSTRPRTRRLHIEAARGPEKQPFQTSPGPHALPWSCPGCGALTQTVDPNEAGFYTITRKSVKAFISNHIGSDSTEKPGEVETYTSAVRNLDGPLLKELGLEDAFETGSGRHLACPVWSTPITDS